MKVKWYYVVSIIVLSVGFYLLSPSFSFDGQSKTRTTEMNQVIKTSTLSQKIIGVMQTPIEVYSVYYNNEKIGVLSNLKPLNDMLKEEYDAQFKDDFPQSSIQLSQDILISKELNYLAYENIDNLIVDYIKNLNQFAFETNKITFSNGNVAYIEDLAVFNSAKEKYMLNFIDSDNYNRLKKSQYKASIPEGIYESVFTSAGMEETLTVTRAYGPSDRILKNEEEILHYLSYGYSVEPKFHEIEVGDTVQSIASHYGLYPQQLILVNEGLKSSNQVLQIGAKLNVTYFDSPITVKVEKDNRVKETIYRGEAEWVVDPSMYENETEVVSEGSDGYRDVLYHETYINGRIASGEALSSIDLVKPVSPVIKRGSLIKPSVGSGQFRYPVDNASVICAPHCYAGHLGLDVIDRYNTYGPVLAADSGIVIVVSYNGVNGNWVEIDHQNGLYSYYGHMGSTAITVGTKVEKGQYLGNIGQTGLASTPHVHFEIWRGIRYQGGQFVVCSYVGC